MDEPILLDTDGTDSQRVESTVVTSRGRGVVGAGLGALFIALVVFAATQRSDPAAEVAEQVPVTAPSAEAEPAAGEEVGAVTELEWFEELASSFELRRLEVPISGPAGEVTWRRLQVPAGAIVQSAGLSDGRPRLLVLDDSDRHLTATLDEGPDGLSWEAAPVARPEGARLRMAGNGLLVAVNRDRAAAVSFDGTSWITIKAIDGATWTGTRLGETAVVGFETLSRRGLFFVDAREPDGVVELSLELPPGRGLRVVHDGSQWLVAAPTEEGPRFFRSDDGMAFTEVEAFAQAPAMGLDGTFTSANPPVVAQGVDLFRLITSGEAIRIADYPGLTLTEAASRGRLTAIVGVPIDPNAPDLDLPETVTIFDTADLGARLEFDLVSSEWRFYTPSATAPSLEFFVNGPESLRDAGVTLNERDDGSTEIQIVHLGSGVALFRFSLDDVTEQLDGLNVLDGSATPSLSEPSVSWTVDDGQEWTHLPLSVLPIDSVIPSIEISSTHLVLMPDDPRRPILFGERPFAPATPN